ncbi:MAG: DUF359 domain-containing protein [Candidatus Micrarchaeota archaeon]|nr:DUF359 domain-containing protein [Candidatus Micrarchaeota archaeon]
MKSITPALRRKLKKPMGDLFVPRRYRELPGRLNERLVCAVGDATVQRLEALGVAMDVAVYDLRCRRKPLARKKEAFFEKLPGVKIVAVNPAGTITPSLENAVSLALSAGTAAKIFVVGEEDLAVIPLLRAMDHGRICYGQPGRGMVVVDVNHATKSLAEKYYAAFKDAP